MSKRARRVKKNNPGQTAFTRFMLVVALLVVWMGGISARLVHLQVTKHEWLRERAAGQRFDVRQSKLPRGTIYDRNGRALAISVRVKTLFADPMEIEDIAGAAKAIARATGGKEKELNALLTDAKADERRFVPIAKGMDEAAVDRINRLLDDPLVRKADEPNFTGLHWREEQKREYPNGPLAAHVIGFSNSEGTGQAGIEQSQNDVLYGAVIKKVQERDRLGRVYDETVSEKEPPMDVALTISATIQYMVEQALEKAVKQSHAKAGTAIVIDNKTGEVLALANNPTFDPNKLNEITSENLSNAAVQQVISPGSVFKLITYGSALESRMISPDAEIDSGNGTIEVAKHRFRDSTAIGRVSYTKAFAQSSNVCAIKTGMRVGREGFYRSVLDFGFGKRTGIELPAETNGIVRHPDRWFGDSLASMSIGYEIGVTPLQMAAAFATIANDGVYIQPHILKEVRLPGSALLRTSQPEKRRVVSVETARALRLMMREVVLSGTGKRAQLNGYTSAGKTGTAWKFDEETKRVNSAKYVSSFIGMAPAEDPAVTIAVIIDEPKTGGRGGGAAAGPVFREIAEMVLPELNIRPDSGEVPADERQDEDGLDLLPQIVPAVDNFAAALTNVPVSHLSDQPLDSEKKAVKAEAEAEKRISPVKSRPPEKDPAVEKTAKTTPPAAKPRPREDEKPRTASRAPAKKKEPAEGKKKRN
ncbi:MAG: penicillin-binding transpeptidase domain-containing protein [Pyrinomonadaceae bacterium]